MKKLLSALFFVLMTGPAIAGMQGAYTQSFSTNGNNIVGTVPVANGGTGASNNSLSKMKIVSSQFENSNLLINSATAISSVLSQTSSPSYTGYTNVISVSNGFTATFTGDTTSGSKVIKNISSMTGLVSGMPIAEAVSLSLPTKVPYYAKSESVDTTNSTLTLSDAAIATSTGTKFYAWYPNVDLIGGPITSVSSTTGTMAVAWKSSGLSSTFYNPYALEFYTDAANFTTSSPAIWLTLSNNSISSISYNYRIAVDGVYQTSAPVYMNPAGTTGWQTIYLGVTLTTPGIHKVRIELPTYWILQQLYTLNGASFWKPSNATKIKALMIGDSYFISGATLSWPGENIAWSMCNRMGFTPYVSAVGGTGYVNDKGGTAYNWANTLRMADWSNGNYDAIFIYGSINDSSFSRSTLQANALSTWTSLRSYHPLTPIFIFGVPVTNGVTQSIASDMETHLKAAFVQFNDSNSYFIPISTDPEGAWITSSNLSFSGGGYIDGASASSYSVTSGSPTLTINTMTSGAFRVGQTLSGTGIPSSTTILSLGTGTGQTGTYTMSANATASGSGSVTAGDFTHPSDPQGTIYQSARMAQKIKEILKKDSSY